MLYQSEWKSPVGELILVATKTKLCLCDWKYRKMRQSIDQRIRSHYKEDIIHGTNTIIDKTISQLEEYFHNHRSEFSIPLELVGTDFQRRVWEELIKIPFGKTTSYLNLSKQLGDQNAIRAVAAANGANAISVLVPCHRVIGSDGCLVGYAGGLNAKKETLVYRIRSKTRKSILKNSHTTKSIHL